MPVKFWLTIIRFWFFLSYLITTRRQPFSWWGVKSQGKMDNLVWGMNSISLFELAELSLRAIFFISDIQFVIWGVLTKVSIFGTLIRFLSVKFIFKAVFWSIWCQLRLAKGLAWKSLELCQVNIIQKIV